MLKLFHVAIFVAVCVKVFSLPSDVEKCKIDDDDCLTKSANKVLQNYFVGITDIDLVSLDPFLVSQIIINRKYGSLDIKDGDLTDVKLRGWKSSKIERISGFENNYVDIQFKVPKSTYTGSFKADAKVLFLPINTNGIFELNLYDYDGTINIKLERYLNNGTKYFRTNGFCVHSTVRTGDVDATGVDSIIMWLINQTFDFFFKDNIKSFIDELFSENYEKAINKMLTKVPIEELFQCEGNSTGC